MSRATFWSKRGLSTTHRKKVISIRSCCVLHESPFLWLYRSIVLPKHLHGGRTPECTVKHRSDYSICNLVALLNMQFGCEATPQELEIR